MTSRSRKIFQVVALALIVSLTQVYVLGNVGAASVREAGLLSGRLSTSLNHPITVNGIEAQSGATIISGTEITTPSDVNATVQLASLGTLNIAPATTLSLTFDNKNVNVNVAAGQADLVTNEGVNGKVTNPDGKATNTDGSKFFYVPGAKPAMTQNSLQTLTIITVIVSITALIVGIDAHRKAGRACRQVTFTPGSVTLPSPITTGSGAVISAGGSAVCVK